MHRMTRYALFLAACTAATSCGGTTQPPQRETSTAGAAATNVSNIQCPPRGPFDDSSGYFSQFYEDYILSYVLRDESTGTYVDVGANNPDVASVTKYFYRRGWRGVNIEPNPDMLALLQKSRPEDVNVGVGISDTPGTLTFYNFPTVPGISTFDRDIALQHRERGFAFEEESIPVKTLNDVLQTNERVSGGFTFLNVDVEGFEQHVLNSIDLGAHPAAIVMVESTVPDTNIPTYQNWEPILFSAGYHFAMDDGLNRYYVHPSHTALLPRFVTVDYCVRMDKLDKGIRLNGVTEDSH
jgi:FkbM family methyltransferase